MPSTTLRLLLFIVSNSFLRNPHRLSVQLHDIVFQTIFLLRDTLGGKSVCGDDIGSCRKIFLMDIINNVGTCQDKNVVVSLQLHWNITKQLATEVLFA